MKNTEFKSKQFEDTTVYTLESASSGGTSSGSIASVSNPVGAVQRRKPGQNLIAQEGDKAKVDTSKPRNFVAKNAKMGGAGAHKDKKKAAKQGDVKHKNKEMDTAEGAVEEGSTHGWNVVRAYEKTGGDQLKIIRWLRKEAGLPKDAPVYFDDADLVYGDKTIVRDALVNPKLTMQDLLNAVQGANTQHSHQYDTTMKHADNPTYQQRMAAHDIKPGVSGYRDRIAMLKDLERTGKLKNNESEFEDHEIQMASSELQSITKNASQLLDLVRKYSEQEGLEAWQQSKITKAADYLNAVLQSVSGEQSPMEEAYGRSSYYNPMDQERREQDYMDYQKRAFKRAELQHELGHEDDPDFERNLRQQQIDRDRGPWYLKIDGKIFKSKGEVKTFDWKRGANNYALAIIKNKPELQGKIFLTKNPKDDQTEDHSTATGGWGQGAYSAAAAGSKWSGAGHDEVQREDAYIAELFNQLSEKIPKNAPVDVWIKDFEKSNAPQFRGKTKEKRRQMAIAASYGAKNPSKKK